MLVNAAIIARLESNLLDKLANEIMEVQPILQSVASDPRFLTGDLNCILNLRRIVSGDLSADRIFQRRNDLAARGVIFRVRGKDHHYVQRQAHRVTLNMHVAFLPDVEKSDLNLASKIRQFVDSKDATVGAR